MSRYANRPQQQSYQRPQSYYEQDLGNYPSVGYADDDDGTMVQTDVSALPPRHSAGAVRASWGANDTRYFDGDAPPDTVERERPRRAAGGASLAVPSSGGRPRAHSFDGGRPQQPLYERYAAPPSRQAYPAAPPARQAYRAPPPLPEPAREPAYRGAPPAPQAAYRRAPVPAARYYEDEPADDSDDDKFTAVGTGVATDLDFEEDEHDGYAGGVAEQSYGRDPREGEYHRRTVGGFAGYDNEGSGRVQQGANGRGGYGVAVEAQRNGRRVAGAGYADEDLGPSAGGRLVPPTGRGQRPTSPSPSGGGRGRYESPVPVRAAPPVDVPEDSPEERNLIRLLKDMNFSVALKDFHDTFGIGVQKTIVAADGFGHAYCKIHCKKLPRHTDIDREPHLKKHWVPMAGNRWQFRTESHKVEILFKSAAVGAYETVAKYGAPPPRR